MKPRILSPLVIVVLTVASLAQAAEEKTFRILERTAEPLLKAERPWEDFCIGYCQVIRDGNTWHLWYASYDHDYKDDRDGMLCYARSTDGVKWERPNLGLVEYNGSKDNNIVFRRAVHGHCVMLDESAPPEERFKMTYVDLVDDKQWEVFGQMSRDGFHWKKIEKPLLRKNSDTQSACFKDGNLYRLYVRMWSNGNFGGKRQVGYSESKSFGDFPDPVVVLTPDEKDPDDLQFYNSAAAKVRGGFYLMFPSAFYTKADTVLPHLAFSEDGKHFRRVGREPFIELGKGFDSKTIYVGPGITPTEKPSEFWIYYVGAGVGHDANLPDKPKFSGGIGRARIAIER